MMPSPGLGQQIQIEIPQHSCQDDPHLVVRQALPQTVSCAQTERLRGSAAVVVERGGGIVVGGREPAFRSEGKRQVEIGGTPGGGEGVNTDGDLGRHGTG